jgi:hypothetical protein
LSTAVGWAPRGRFGTIWFQVSFELDQIETHMDEGSRRIDATLQIGDKE